MQRCQHPGRRDDDVALIRAGRAAALVWSNSAVLKQAGVIIDRQPHGDHQELALTVRDLVATSSEQILRDLEGEAGPAPLAFDASWVQAVTELRMALGQCHGDRDLRDLGRLQ